MTVSLILPDPACSFGYPLGQVREILGEDRTGELWRWLRVLGCPVGICTGRRWNPAVSYYEPTACAPSPHGPVVYPVDLARFLQQAAA